MIYCVYCQKLIDPEYLGSGTVNDHWPCGLPCCFEYKDEHFSMIIGPIRTPLRYDNVYLHKDFHPSYWSEGMGT